MGKIDNSERIERFLRNEMSAEDSEAFIRDLKNDPALLEEAQMMAMLIKVMKEEQAKQDEEMKEIAKSEDDSGTVIIPMVKNPAANDTHVIAAAENTPAAATGDVSVPAAARRKHRWILWAASVAVMLVLVFGAIKLFNSKTDQPEPVMAEKKQTKKKKTPKLPPQRIEESNAAEDPSKKTEENKDEENDVTMEGGSLIEINVGTGEDNHIRGLLAEFDQRLKTETNLGPVIDSLQHILNNIHAHNEDYALYEQYEQRITRMLYEAYVKTDDKNMALEMQKNLVGADMAEDNAHKK